MSVSIIIVSFNTKSHLKECLDSLHNSKLSVSEVVVVDNGSLDGSIALLRSRSSRITLLENAENFGFARAANQAAAVCTGDYLLFLNSDVVVASSLASAQSYLEDHRDVGVLGLRMTDPHGRVQDYTWGSFQNLFDLITKRSKKAEVDNNRIQETDWVSGGAMLVRRDLFELLEGFDDRFFFYFEDMDFCARARRWGAKVVFFPKVSIRHAGGASFRGDDKKRRGWYYASQAYFFRKHYGFGAWLLLKLFRYPVKLFFR